MTLGWTKICETSKWLKKYRKSESSCGTRCHNLTQIREDYKENWEGGRISLKGIDTYASHLTIAS